MAVKVGFEEPGHGKNLPRRAQKAKSCLRRTEGAYLSANVGRLTPQRARFAQSECLVGVVPLGRGRERLHDLRLETKGDDPVFRRAGDDRRVFFAGRADDVAGEHRNHGRRLVAVAAGILKSENKKPEIVFTTSGFAILIFVFQNDQLTMTNPFASLSGKSVNHGLFMAMLTSPICTP